MLQNNLQPPNGTKVYSVRILQENLSLEKAKKLEKKAEETDDLSTSEPTLPVDEAAQMLTINTHKGLFKYTRLNYGIKTAPSIFQQLMDTMRTNIPGTVAYLDDILVVGRTDEEMLQRLDKVMENLIDYGLKINFKSEFLRKKSATWDLCSRRRMVEVFDVAAATAEVTPKKTEDLISRYGISTEIVTENGTQFTSSVFRQLC
ncbi:unnamed protein product [Schistocephalus solidus]|uniref:Reverse transcriptase domain-containing protein n=1 Tax=Schistocephalus solidus TaxID=70667 RepID=A0A3P7DFN0_SCHSO|nr:unnamed protein product [Schistocephalus solidus]